MQAITEDVSLGDFTSSRNGTRPTTGTASDADALSPNNALSHDDMLAGGDIFARNNVTVAGSGSQTIIFGHGFGCDQTMWRFVQPDLAKNYRTILFDYVGSGRSDLDAYDATRYSSIDGYASDVLDICTALNIYDAIFVGHSFSGMVGVAAAIRQPERFSRLIMIGSSARFLNDPPAYIGGFERDDVIELLSLMDRNMVGWANFLAPVAMKNEDRPELSDELATSLRSGDPDVLRRFADVVFLGDNRAMLARCHTPALILQCSEDSIAPATAGEFLNAALPNSTLVYMEARGHCPHVSHPQETLNLIREYLATSA